VEKILSGTKAMRMAKRIASRGLVTSLRGGRNGKPECFRDLKAFGLWADRKDLKDPIRFTSQLRARMEQRADAR
jgi:hypothetical protein